MVSNDTMRRRVGLNLEARTSYLKPKNGFLAVEKSTLAKPLYAWMGKVPLISTTRTKTRVKVVLSGKNRAQSI
jgi:hypothetical protein